MLPLRFTAELLVWLSTCTQPVMHEGSCRCAVPMQALHRLEVIVTRGYEGKTTRAFVGQMTEDKALESAGKIASESLIFGVCRPHAWQHATACRVVQQVSMFTHCTASQQLHLHRWGWA